MSTPDYARIAQRTLEVISEKGGPVTFPGAATSGGTEETYNPATDRWTAGSGTSSTPTGRAVRIDGDPNKLAALNLLTVKNVALMIAAAGLSVTPAPGMVFTWGDTEYVARAVNTIDPSGSLPLLHEVYGGVGV